MSFLRQNCTLPVLTKERDECLELFLKSGIRKVYFVIFEVVKSRLHLLLPIEGLVSYYFIGT